MGGGVSLPSYGNQESSEIDGIQQPIITDPTAVKGKLVPLEIEVSIAIPDTRTPMVASVQDLWIEPIGMKRNMGFSGY